MDEQIKQKQKIKINKGAIVLIFVVLAFLIMLIEYFIVPESESEKLYSFIDKLSEKYNTEFLSQHSQINDSLKQQFSLYTDSPETLEAQVIKLKGDKYVPEAYLIFFRRIYGNSAIVLYNPKLNLDDFGLTGLGNAGIHLDITSTKVENSVNPHFYSRGITFTTQEVLNDSERNGVIAGEGIYSFDESGNLGYIKNFMNRITVETNNSPTKSKDFLSIIKEVIRKDKIFYPILKDYSDIITLFTWLIILGGVPYTLYEFLINWFNKKKKLDNNTTVKNNSVSQ